MSTDRFWKRVDKSPGLGPKGDCWEWIGARRPEGYGRYCRDGTSVPAARESWERRNKTTFPKGKLACHRCDNPPCVNPEHIFPGSALENTADSIAKKRFVKIKPPAVQSHCKKGHAFTADNVRYKANGRRECILCGRARSVSKRAKRKDAAKYKKACEVTIAAHKLINAIGNKVSEEIKEPLENLIRALAR